MRLLPQVVKLKNVLYIHGANSTFRSFRFLRNALPEHNHTYLEYRCSTPLAENMELVRAELKRLKPDAIVAHSLGGVMAAACKMDLPETKLVTLASPFGGSMAANFLRFHGQLFCDVASMNPFFNRLKKHEFDDTLLAIVATGLEPDAFESDGVVTIRSQTALSGCSYERVALNHFEILLDSSVAEMTRRHVFD